MARGSTERTYSIWGFVALFAFMALFGLALLLLSVGSDDSTVQVTTPQTLPDDPAAAGG